MQNKRVLNREYTKEEIESKKPRPMKKNIDDYKPSGNLYKNLKTSDGRRINYIEPEDSSLPTTKYRLFCFKNDEEIEEPLYMDKRSFYIFGTDQKNVDSILMHKTCEGQHAVIQFRHNGDTVLPYIIDLNSKYGTYLNKCIIKPSTYIELREGDMLMFGKSQREYILVIEKPIKTTRTHSK
ncbi:hypothetical protein EIN_020790 [Entamoeba invadens IP1]|uniref:hypothetical protein n=1 Tax=Entamoeba invadens IP1 TaxID=370355 RepID=UPI0002C3DCCF|nr:hypothetical protein EIN_020790 [Entamoeba invadens IP1]ELP90600.1 hypothetical protein EIN_020790 [Entamoeba invadens IP1]|eukprot:XP_004257371.1 hypothetical protein EIN_020790 [Entamoeba invadens IP1]